MQGHGPGVSVAWDAEIQRFGYHQQNGGGREDQSALCLPYASADAAGARLGRGDPEWAPAEGGDAASAAGGGAGGVGGAAAGPCFGFGRDGLLKMLIGISISPYILTKGIRHAG